MLREVHPELAEGLSMTAELCALSLDGRVRERARRCPELAEKVRGILIPRWRPTGA